jgi:hypothetical protein
MESNSNQDNQPKDNPFLKVENPYEDYAASQARNLQNKHAQEVMKLQKICYMMLQSDSGKEWLKEFENKFMLQTLYNPSQTGVEQLSIYWEGFRDCIRTVKQMSDMHAQMITELTT